MHKLSKLLLLLVAGFSLSVPESQAQHYRQAHQLNIHLGAGDGKAMKSGIFGGAEYRYTSNKNSFSLVYSVLRNYQPGKQAAFTPDPSIKASSLLYKRTITKNPAFLIGTGISQVVYRYDVIVQSSPAIIDRNKDVAVGLPVTLDLVFPYKNRVCAGLFFHSNLNNKNSFYAAGLSIGYILHGKK